MKKITKLFLYFLAAAMLLATLTACHGSRGPDAFVLPETFDASRDYEITFWAKNDTNVRQTAIYEQAIAEFEALYPNIKVTMRLYNDYGKIYNDVITNISTGTTPNVCITYPDHIATYLTGTNTVVPLGQLMQDAAYGLGGSEVRFDAPSTEQMIPKYLQECYVGDDIYALPFMRSSEACYVNVDMVESLGYTVPDVLTWDYVWEVAEAAMAKDEEGNYLVNGQSVMIPVIYKSTDNMMIQMLRQRGAGYSDDKGNVDIFNETTEELLYTIAEHAGTGAFSTFKISSYPGNFFNAGQCIFAIDSTAGATWIGSDAPLQDIHECQVVQFETRVMTVPQFDPEHPAMISQGPSMCIFNKEDPQEVLASWLFMQYLLTDDIQIAYSQTEGYTPVTAKAQQSEAYREYLSRAGEDNELYYDVKLAATRLVLENTENTFVTAVFNGSASLRNAAGQLIENVTKSKQRRQTVDDAYIETLFREVSSLYRLDQLGAAGVNSGERAELGALPTASVVLLCLLGGTWLCIITYILHARLKKIGNEKKKNM